jgi:antirestriction protein ArdC
MSRESARIDPYQIVTDLILEHLERGVVPWRQPWNHAIGRPRNFHSDRPYRGINVILLGLHRFASPYWLTIRQANARGGRVRKGEHGAAVIKFGTLEKLDEEQKKTTRYYLKSYRVFNAVQIEGIEFPKVTAPVVPEDDLCERAADIVKQMPRPPVIQEGRTTRACYWKDSDIVEVPAREVFDNLGRFHHTLFHELVHATGHESRLARPSLMENDGFGEKVYSQEELVAEMGAAFLGMEAGIVSDAHEQSAAYLESWLKVLREKDHRKWIVRAASQAERAADYVLGRIAPVESG